MNPPSNATIIERATATGIDLQKLPFSEDIFCNYVRKSWPTIQKWETGQIVQSYMPVKDGDDYYENVAAAANTGSKELVNLFLETGFELSEEQRNEVATYLARPRHKL